MAEIGHSPESDRGELSERVREKCLEIQGVFNNLPQSITHDGKHLSLQLKRDLKKHAREFTPQQEADLAELERISRAIKGAMELFGVTKQDGEDYRIMRENPKTVTEEGCGKLCDFSENLKMIYNELVVNQGFEVIDITQ